MANSNNLVRLEHGPVQISESINNGDDCCYGAEGYSGIYPLDRAGELSCEDDFTEFSHRVPLPTSHIEQIGHNFGTFEERLYYENVQNDPATWRQANSNYGQTTSFPEAQELQFVTAEGPGTLSDDTISTNTSEGGSPIFITPLEHHTLGSIDLPELCSPAKSVLNDRVTIRSAGSDSSVLGDFPRSQISSDVDPSSFRLRPRYGEETAVEIQICDRDPNRYYCQKVDHPCRFGRNNGNGFGRIQDRDRHEKVLHPTKEHPSGREPCPKCGVLMRPDKHGEHWRKSCKENPHRKPH